MTHNPADLLIAVIGGSGFIGRHVVRALAKRGYRIRVGCRRPDLAGHLQPLGFPGQIALVQTNIRYPASIAALAKGAHTVVYLPGVLSPSGPQSFDNVHNFGAAATAKAAKAAGATLNILISAIGADLHASSDYAKSKAYGEQAAKAAFPGTMVIRPSIVFGPEDDFFNRFAEMARFSPALPLIGGGETNFQPVFVGDVAETIARLIERDQADGKTYELGGPEIMSFRQVLDYVLHVTGRRRFLVSLPWAVAQGVASISGLLPGAPLTSDQLKMLQNDNVVGPAARQEGRTLEGLGIRSRSVQSVVPEYLYRYRKAGQFTPPEGIPEM